MRNVFPRCLNNTTLKLPKGVYERNRLSALLEINNITLPRAMGTHIDKSSEPAFGKKFLVSFSPV